MTETIRPRFVTFVYDDGSPLANATLILKVTQQVSPTVSSTMPVWQGSTGPWGIIPNHVLFQHIPNVSPQNLSAVTLEISDDMAGRSFQVPAAGGRTIHVPWSRAVPLATIDGIPYREAGAFFQELSGRWMRSQFSRNKQHTNCVLYRVGSPAPLPAVRIVLLRLSQWTYRRPATTGWAEDRQKTLNRFSQEVRDVRIELVECARAAAAASLDRYQQLIKVFEKLHRLADLAAPDPRPVKHVLEDWVAVGLALFIAGTVVANEFDASCSTSAYGVGPGYRIETEVIAPRPLIF